MDCDVAVLGGGPGGYTAAIRAAQLGAKVVCIEKEDALGGTCLRVGCIPTKAWVQTAAFLHDANAKFAKLGVHVEGAQLDFGAANEWKTGVVKQMTQGVAEPLQGERRRVGEGPRPLHRPEHDRGRGRRRGDVQVGGRRDGVVPAAPADPGARVGSVRRLDGPARADGGAAAPGRAGGRHHRLRVRLDLQPLRLRGDDRRDARHAHPAGGRGCGEGAREGVHEARHRAAAREAVHGRRAARQHADRALRRRRGGRVRPDARLGRPWAAGRGARPGGGRGGVRPAEGHRRRRPPAHERAAYLRGRRLRGLLAARPHGVPGGRGRGRERVRPRGDRQQPGGPAPDLHRPGDRGRRPDRGRRRARRTATTSRSASSRGSRTRGR